MSVLQNPPDPRRDHLIGSLDAPIVLVEYGDFECPFCRMTFFELHDVRREMGDDMCQVFRHFPLSRIHPHGVAAAETAEAAGAQGKFWEMHDMLYQHQDELEYPDLLRHARRLRLDVDAIEDALMSHAFLPRIREDFFSGVRSGVNGTPSLFINGRRHDGGWDAPSLLYAMRQELRRAGAEARVY